MFPEVDTYETEIEAESESAELGQAPLYDFNKKEYILKDGKIVMCSQKEAVAQWLGFLVSTTVGRYPVYKDSEFGTYIENYIGYKDEAFVFSEIKREIQEKAVLNRAIGSVDDFEITREKDKLTVSMVAALQSGEEQEVTVDV